MSRQTATVRAAAYYTAQSAHYRRAGLPEAADRCELQAALARTKLAAAHVCADCGKALETEASRARGVGPVCAKASA